MSCLLFLQGRIGKIEKKLVKNDLTIVTISIASNNPEDKNKDGSVKTEWTDVTAVGKRADAIFNYSKKGDIVSVIARKTTNKVSDGNGGNRYFTNYYIQEGYSSFQTLYKSGKEKEEASKSGQDTSNVDYDSDDTSTSLLSEKNNHTNTSKLEDSDEIPFLDMSVGTGFKQDKKADPFAGEEIPE